MRWLRALAVMMSLGVIFGAFVAIKMQYAAGKSEKAADDAARAVKEQVVANKELLQLKISLQNIMKEVQKARGLSQIESSTAIQITAGDKPGEVNIFAPQVTRAQIETAKSKVEDAVNEGKPIPVLPQTFVTARIPAQIKRVDMTDSAPPQALGAATASPP